MASTDRLMNTVRRPWSSLHVVRRHDHNR